MNEQKSKHLTMYSKVGCVYCEKATTFAEDMQIDLTTVVLDPLSSTYALERDNLISKCGGTQKTFPFILRMMEVYLEDTLIW